MALFHHEHWDGTGYPFRLVGEEIPLVARIMAAADILDALLSERPYKRAYSLEESFKFISTLNGNCLEPAIVEAILAAQSEISEIYNSFIDVKDELPTVDDDNSVC
jgi:HD-GYP domain-containing protein (c-di-GMP phosphodiesterase class II)